MRPLNQRESEPRRVVIVGCGRLGVSVATSLTNRGHIVHILDSCAEAFSQLPPGEINDGHIVPVIGNGTLHQDLVRASIQDADVFMALSNADTKNALAALMAKQVYQVSTVICRIDDPTVKEIYENLNILAISATTLITDVVLEAAGS